MRFIKLKVFAVLALMVCMGAFSIPAYASSGAPPTVAAWINGDGLFIEVSGGQQGIEAVFINNARVNYRVDSKLELSAASYAGTGQYISVYAVDFGRNKSNAVDILNPFYIPAPVTTPIPTETPATPAPNIALTPAPAEMPVPTSTSVEVPAATLAYTVTHTPIAAASEPETPEAEPANIPAAEPEATPVPTAEPVEPNPFTPDGEGAVMDTADETDGKEFYTINTEDGNVFYMVVDRQRATDNVYFLNAVTEQDLAALAQKSGTAIPGASAVATPEPTPTPTPTETPEPEPETPEKPAANNSMYILLVVVVIGVGGAGYYFKIYKGKKDAPDSGSGEYEDDYGYSEETEAEDDTEADSEEEQE